MKRKRLLWIIPSLVTALSVTGCSRLLSLFGIGNKVEVTTVDKTELSYTYHDYLNHNYYRIDGTPSKGAPKLLIIPVWFTDSSKYIPADKKDKVRNDIQKAYLGSESDTGWNSVSSYYSKLSGGLCNLRGVVSSWYECGTPSTNFYSEDKGQENTMKLVKSATNWYFDGKDTSDFDLDGNGYLDGVILIYGAPDYGALNNDNAANLWAYCYWIQEAAGTKNAATPNAYFWASYDFMYGSNAGVGNYHSGDTNYCKIDTHTYIHEMGHMFGLEDYYDYSGQYCPAGGFSMQDYNTGSHDPYSIMALGWASPMVPTETCTLSIKPFQSNHDLVLLSPSFLSKSPFDEYLLVEYYTPTGLNKFDVDNSYCGYYPQGPESKGIRLWHVDARLIYSTSVEGDLSNAIVSNIEDGKYYTHAMSNTYYGSQGKDYVSPLGPNYYDCNILSFIRNSTKETTHPKYVMDSDNLFRENNSFSMSSFKKQFVNGDTLNNGNYLRWSFMVVSLSDDEAIVTFTKK